MANNEHINKVVKSTGETLIDLTNDTVTAGTLLKDVTAHDRSGAQITGAVIVAPTDVTETSDTTPYIYKSSEHDAIYDELVGGSVAWNQLAKPISSWGYGNIDISTSSDGVMTINGTATENTYPILNDVEYSISGHKYYVTLNRTDLQSGIKLYNDSNGVDVSNGKRIQKSTGSSRWYLRIAKDTVCNNVKITPQIIDLTQMFGSTIADYVYSLEQSTAGSGVDWLKSYGFFTKDYYAYNAGGLISVNTSGKKVADENAEITYPFQSTDLRGLYKLDSNNKLYTDGDIYSADGQITRKYGYRGYQSGDESLANAITDGTHTIYKLSAPTTETASPFTSPQMIYRNGTEEYLDTRDVPIPVGGNRKYVDIPEWMVNEYFDDVRAETSILKTISKLQQENEVLRNALSQSTYFIPEGTTTITVNTITDKTKCFYYIPNSVTSFDIYAFANCDSLTSITIPNSVTSIDSSAFFECTSLTSVTIPDSITSIVDSMFFGCTSLKSVVIPNSITSIQSLAFYKCTSLTSVTIPNSITSIGSSAFEDCTSLREIAIPDSITSINSTAFEDCTNLISITVDKPQGSISGAPWGAPNATVTWTG